MQIFATLLHAYKNNGKGISEQGLRTYERADTERPY